MWSNGALLVLNVAVYKQATIIYKLVVFCFVRRVTITPGLFVLYKYLFVMQSNLSKVPLIQNHNYLISSGKC
jgi:hypothetical protein